jgi:hypothetical protein
MPAAPSSGLFPHSVTVRKAFWSNVGGARTATYLDMPMMAAVQPMKHARVVRYDQPAGLSLFTCYFAADPDLKVDDVIVWNGRSLAALATARDEAGQGVVWSVDCREIL